MKLKQIEAILKEQKTIIVFETPYCQWLGNGADFYPVYNLPKLTQSNIFTMFDIADDKRDKFYFEERELPRYLNFEDADDSETILDRGKIELFVKGIKLEPIKIQQGIAFINSRYLKPFSDSEAGYELYERTDDLGRPYIVAKSGFMLLGIFATYDIVNEEFIETLETIVSLSKVTLFNKKEKAAKTAEPNKYSYRRC